jgi:hypothetical protein
MFLSARAQTLSYNYHVEEMVRKLHKASEFTSFIVFYPDISKTQHEGRIGDITSTLLEERYVKVKQFTGKITSIFKKEDEEENVG